MSSKVAVPRYEYSKHHSEGRREDNKTLQLYCCTVLPSILGGRFCLIWNRSSEGIFHDSPPPLFQK